MRIDLPHFFSCDTLGLQITDRHEALVKANDEKSLDFLASTLHHIEAHWSYTSTFYLLRHPRPSLLLSPSRPSTASSITQRPILKPPLMAITLYPTPIMNLTIMLMLLRTMPRISSQRNLPLPPMSLLVSKRMRSLRMKLAGILLSNTIPI